MPRTATQRLIAVLRCRFGSASARSCFRASQVAAPPPGTEPGRMGAPIMMRQHRTKDGRPIGRRERTRKAGIGRSVEGVREACSAGRGDSPMSHTSSSAERADVYTRITAEIVAAMEAGAGVWRMPWHHDGTAITRPQNISSGNRYRGVNVLALWIAAQAHGYADGLWGTYRQWLAIGAQVRKGERGTTVVLWKQAKAAINDDADDGDDDVRRRVFARAFTVFNVAQVDGYEPQVIEKLPEGDRLTHVGEFIDALKVPIVTGNYNAHYRIDLDMIFMPEYAAFTSPAAQAGTLIHEAAHATGAKHRLDRNFQERFKRDWLPIEEATAELTASFILADLGVAHHPRPDHAAYVASWLRLLKDDPRAIFTAASKAQQAADWMHAQQPRTEEMAA